MKRLLPVLAAALLLATAACGDGAAGGGSGAADKTIRIAYQAFPSGDLIVKNQGLLEKALPDYKITWTKFDSGASINTAFLGRSIDIAAIGSSPVARGLSAPLNIPYQVAFVLDVAGDNEALVARDGSGVTDVAGLRGKKVAAPFASTAHYSLLAALDRAGVKESELTIVDLEPQDILAAKPADLASDEWLGTEAKVGKLADNLVSASEFLKRQQKIDAVPDLATVRKAVYVKGLPDVLG